MREKYLAIKLCRVALQVAGFGGLLLLIMLGSVQGQAVGSSFIGTLAGLFAGCFFLALCFGLAEVLKLLTDVERELRGLRDDMHDRFPTPDERIQQIRQRTP